MTRYTLKRPVCEISVGLMLSGFLLLPSIGFAQANTWTKKADIPTPRAVFATAVVDGKIYAIGGGNGVGQASSVVSTVEAYDPATDTWTQVADMPTARRGLATAVVNGVIYAIGGFNSCRTLANVEADDPATDSWTEKTSMPTARGGFFTSVVNGKIYVIGGWRVGNVLLSTVEMYDTGFRPSPTVSVNPQGKLATTWATIKQSR